MAIVAMPLPKWEEKKNSLRQWHCRNRGYKILAIVAMALPKMEKKKCYEICERVKKKKVVMSTIFLQYFHNKSQVISYY